jgi:hypothetical protein
MSRQHTKVSVHEKESLFFLTVEFLGYLHREEDVSYSKGELGRQQLHQYLVERHAAKLEESDGPQHRTKTKHKQTTQPTQGLCPDSKSMDHFLGQYLNFLSPQYYKTAALMELIPAWLRFLLSHQLIDQQQMQQTLHDLKELVGMLLDVLVAFRSDPALSEGLKEISLSISQIDSGE